MNILLWLDDVRDPSTNNSEWLAFSPISQPYSVAWVKSYDEFTNWIKRFGLPTAICFDHDLGDDSLTGFDCSKWLIEYCLDNDKDLPLFNIQSANPVGKENINSILTNFIKFRQLNNKK